MGNRRKNPGKSDPLFALSRRGYDREAVEAYINMEFERAEKAGLEQKERIAEMKAQLKNAEEQLAFYREREEQIKTTLVQASAQAERMSLDVKFRYAMELERLKMFRAKWLSAYDEMKERYHFSKDALNMESVALSTKIELERFLAQEFTIEKGASPEEMEAQFRAESERLDSETESKIAELKDKLVRAQEKIKSDPAQKEPDTAEAPKNGSAAFSLEEAIHPKESLAEICKYLGLGEGL